MRPDIICITATGIVLAIEMFAIGWRRSSLVTVWSRSGLIDLAFCALRFAGLLWPLVAVITLTGSPRLDASIRQLGLRLDAGWWGTNLLLAVLLSSFLWYWLHRLYHTRLLWWSHRTHHAAKPLNAFSTFRANPVDHIFDAIPSTIPVVLFNISPFGATALTIFIVSLQTLQHAPLPWSYGWLGKWVFVSPMGHAIHHSPDPRDFNKNLSPMFTIWDRAFGTYAASMAK